MFAPAAPLLLGLAKHGEPGGFDATTIILIFLAGVAGYLVYEFIRDNKGRSGVALVGAVIGHVLLVLFLSLDIPGRLGCGVEVATTELIEFEVAEVEEPEPEPEPEPEKQPEPEPEPEPIEKVEPEKVEPKKKLEPKKQPEPVPETPPEPAPAKRWDLTGSGNSPVKVPQGTGGVYGGTGKADAKGQKPGKPAGKPEGTDEGSGSKWQPRSELFIKDLPKPVKVPKIDCPATAELGVQGDVILKVQIAHDGTIRSVKVVKGIGQGCDQVAVKALKQARFKPAIGTNGQAVDFELRYEYAFTVND